MSSAALIKKIGWLIIIIGKVKILSGRDTDIVETAFLLYAVMRQLVLLCPADVSCALIDSKCPSKINMIIRIP